MHKRYTGFLFIMMCGLAGCSATAEQSIAVESEGWTVSAAAPVVSSDGLTISASMTFARTSGVDTRGGGVCLVADLNNATPCSTQEDCAGLPLPTDGWYYCAAINGVGPKRCWTRPGGDSYCTKSPMRMPGTFTTPSVPATVNDAPTLWVGYACLANSDTPMGCASGAAISTTGPSTLASKR